MNDVEATMRGDRDRDLRLQPDDPHRSRQRRAYAFGALCAEVEFALRDLGEDGADALRVVFGALCAEVEFALRDLGEDGADALRVVTGGRAGREKGGAS